MITLTINPEQQEWITLQLVDRRTSDRKTIEHIKANPSNWWVPNAVEDLETRYKFCGVLLEEVSGHPIPC